MSAFLITVKAEPADEMHCENLSEQKWCQRLVESDMKSICGAFGIRVRLDDGMRYLRCPECLAAEREARDEVPSTQ